MSSTTQYIRPSGAIVPRVGIGYLNWSHHAFDPGSPALANGLGASRYLSIGRYQFFWMSCQASSRLIGMTPGAGPEESCVTSHSRTSPGTPMNSTLVSGYSFSNAAPTLAMPAMGVSEFSGTMPGRYI